MSAWRRVEALGNHCGTCCRWLTLRDPLAAASVCLRGSFHSSTCWDNTCDAWKAGDTLPGIAEVGVLHLVARRP
jgi:hypothetical protein